MKIVIDEFLIEQTEDEFTLFERKTAQSGKHKGEETLVAIGHFVALPNALYRIISLRLARKQSTVNLDTYIRLFNEERKKILNILNDEKVNY